MMPEESQLQGQERQMASESHYQANQGSQNDMCAAWRARV